MLPLKKRLNLKKDFTWVVSGNKLSNQLIKVFFRFGPAPSGPESREPRVGIAVSKSTFKNAVDRNRARRVVSFGFEKLYNVLPSNINIVVLPKGEVLNLNSEEFTKSLEELLNKIKIYEKDSNRNY